MPNTTTRHKKLTPKQEMFCREYLVDLNATQAAIRAGYSVRTAYSQGQRLLKNVEIQAHIVELQEVRSKRTEITADAVLKELARLGFANMNDYVRVNHAGDLVHDFSKLDRDQAAAIVEVTTETYIEGRGKDAETVKKVRFKLGDKKGPLELIGRHLGMFPNRTEITGPDGKDLIPENPAYSDPQEAQRVYITIMQGKEVKDDK